MKRIDKRLIIASSTALLCLTPIIGSAGAQETSAAEASADEDETNRLDQVVVVGRSFRSDADSSASKFELEVARTPQAVAVLDQSVLNDLGAIGVFESTNYIPGVNLNGQVGTQTVVQARGFGLNGLNAFKINGSPIGQPIGVDEVAVDRVEYVKGGNTVGYGEVSPAGFLNLVTRTAPEDYTVEGRLEIGSFGYTRAEGLIGGPLTQDGSTRAIVGLAQEQDDGFALFDDGQQLSVFGALEADLGDRLTARVFAYAHDRSQGIFTGIPVGLNDQGTPDEADDLLFLPDLPDDFTANQPWAGEEGEVSYIEGQLEFQLTDNLGLFGKYSRVEYLQEFRGAEASGSIDLNPASSTFGQTENYAQFSFDRDYLSEHFELRLAGDGTLLGRDLQFYAATEYRDLDGDIPVFSGQFEGETLFIDDPFPGVVFNVFDPNYSVDDPFLGDDRQRSFLIDEDTTVTSGSVAGLYQLTDKIMLMGGVRYDERESDNQFIIFGDEDEVFGDEFSNEVWSGSASVSYEVNEDIIAYYSFGESTEFLAAFNCQGRSLDPETGTVHEVGLKATLTESGLLGTVAVYDAVSTNSPIPDLADDCVFADASRNSDGEQRAQGIEIELIGNITPQWNVLAGYSYTDAERVPDGSVTDLSGFETIITVPEHTFNVYTVYDFDDGPLKGWGVGGGIQYSSDRPADGFGDLDLDSYVLVEASAFYQINDNASLSLVGKNLTDEVVFDSAAGTTFFNLTRRAPRSFLLALDFSF